MQGLLLSLLITAAVFAQEVPTAVKQPVTDEYHGVKVVDDYRWLEDDKSPETEKWLAAENAYSLHYFEHAPAWNLLLHDIKKPKEKQEATQRHLDFRAGRFFYLQPDRTVQQQRETADLQQQVADWYAFLFEELRVAYTPAP
jgi:prolyl oligopeptidase